jgi:hypothetical protein
MPSQAASRRSTDPRPRAAAAQPRCMCALLRNPPSPAVFCESHPCGLLARIDNLGNGAVIECRHHFMYNESLELTAPQHTAVKDLTLTP